MQLDKLRYELAHPRTSVQLCLLGIVAGVIAALLITLLRLCVEGIQLLILTVPDNFSLLDPRHRFLLPSLAAMLILFVAWLTGFRHYRLGIPFVIHRVKTFYGLMPLRTTINQFFGGMLALACGFSVGREGPAVHLGAAGSSFVGDRLKLPFNSIRILAGCGVAAGISATFNTPFAAVIFVMEVVLREYKIHVFIPVMLAAAVGSLLTTLVFGEVHEMAFLRWVALEPWMYLLLIFFGVGMGGLAALFNHQLMKTIEFFSRFNMATRLLLAGFITGCIGFVLPEAMGSGLTAIDVVIDNPHNVTLLIALLFGKLLLTIIAIGLGIPGGVIGPIFGLGVIGGALFLLPLNLLLEDADQFTGSFGLLGMAGMFTAVLHAPLAALSAVMELSFNPNVILPAMLVIVPAYVTSTQFLNNSSVFIRQLQFQQLPYQTTPVREHLQKTGVIAVMQADIQIFADSNQQQIMQFMEHAPQKLVVLRIAGEDGPEFQLAQWDISLSGEDSRPVSYTTMQGVSAQATLSEVYDILQASRNGAVYVYQQDQNQLIGVVTWSTLRGHLHKQEY
ncbi:chloride channel protein [Bowmanella sp. JS7-9]|uniref:Chloride channel protein n=1 Tax=Pseudobowmanella zhangzhouensis TaxID=1537679 RepID=A0ABW1XLZ5_9ALTE|nr:chloride channel protein [Bowmanella sp. JS7-9]TBX21864.1 voltage-gated chloride channel [Bowmanella sp. JS7-9]